MPAKLVVQTDDLLEQSPISDDFVIAGLRSRQLASTAIGFGAAFVLQASASSLYQLREQMLRGLAYRGPALFSVYSGANGGGLPPYLAAAAAAESRAFPAFTYDPSAGADWASRFSLAGNNQVDVDWPVQRLDYEDAEQQLLSETVAFTLVDFAASDPRCGKYFAEVPRAKWTDDLVPVAEFLDARAERPDRKGAVPDDGRRRQQPAKGDRQRNAGARSAPLRRGLAQPAGARRRAQFARREVARAGKENLGRAGEGGGSAAAASQQASAPAVAPAAAPLQRQRRRLRSPSPKQRRNARRTRPISRPSVAAAATSARRSTTRCSPTTPTNRHPSSRLDAGTYRQLVEAAENCQLSIIHPGKPRNPNEPGLDELIKRAEPFL